MMSNKVLYDELDTLTKWGGISKSVPASIAQNLDSKYDLRLCQVEAFARFIHCHKNDFPGKTYPLHLLFNMATGSGKTLIMAGLILYLYEQGCRNFLFFVHSTNIIEKTRDNFLNPASIKYLFAQDIHIGNPLKGTFATAGYGVGNRLLLIAIIPGFGLANAASTLVGQNLGAGKPDRAERSAWWVSAYTAGYISVVAILLFIFASPLIALFDSTPQVVAYGSECLHIVAFSLIASAIGIVLARGFDGAGNTIPALGINLFTLWRMEIPFSYGLSRWLGLGTIGVWWGRAIANLANGLLFAIWFRRGRWKQQDV